MENRGAFLFGGIPRPYIGVLIERVPKKKKGGGLNYIHDSQKWDKRHIICTLNMSQLKCECYKARDDIHFTSTSRAYKLVPNNYQASCQQMNKLNKVGLHSALSITVSFTQIQVHSKEVQDREVVQCSGKKYCFKSQQYQRGSGRLWANCLNYLHLSFLSTKQEW